MNNIAIDGPAGAGKSTIAKKVAEKLGIVYVDTGALYRVVGLHMLNKKIDLRDSNSVVCELKNCKISMNYVDGIQKMFLCGQDVTNLIRTDDVSMAASTVSAIPKVREFLLDLQRNIGKNQDIIMDGRDIGTVVLPDAAVKIFLTASINLRAKRRYDQLIASGENVVFENVLSEMKKRDLQDMNRKIAPLKQAEDAVLLDTSNLSLEESIENVLKIINSNGVEINK